MAMHTYLVAIGSNLGDRRETVRQALSLITERGVSIVATSELVETDPVGAANQVFLNGAFICKGDISPDDLMRLFLDVESTLGRLRDVRWGNRTIDLDILLIQNLNGDSIENQSTILTVPHPRMLERDFVLRPAAAVAGHWTLPNSEQTLRSLCISRGWLPTWNNLAGDIKLWQALKGDIFAAMTSRWWWPIIVGMFVFRMWISSRIPFGNDEAYYWDWGRAPQASYFDHPPFVSWLAMISRLLVCSWSDGPLQGRLLVPFIHVGSTLMFGALTVRLLKRVLTNLESRAVILISNLIPAFSLGGIMLMPDIGLIFFATVALWIVLAICDRKRLTWWTGIILGIVLGLAGLSKYHAALIGGGMLTWLCWHRRHSLSKEWAFWICVITTGSFMVSPVFYWNMSHAWASIRYQGTRGLSGGGFEIRRALRTIAGEIAFLGPAIIGGLILTWRNRRKNKSLEVHAILCAALPMFFILKFFSFTTQTLPHWSMPSVWLLSVFAVTSNAESGLLRWSARLYGLIFCVAIPISFSFPEARRSILRSLGDRPGGLGELTLWDSVARDPEILKYIFETSWIQRPIAEGNSISNACGRGLVFAAPRWFTVAQAAANLPTHPIIETLDQDHLSYYHFRSKLPVAGCPVVVLAEAAHWREDGWNNKVKILASKDFEVEGHRDRHIVVGRGWFHAESSENPSDASRH